MAEPNASINGSTGGNNHSGQTPEENEIWEFFREVDFAQSFVWVISAIEIPIMIVTLFALCVLLKSQRSAPVFVIHLILSDLIQIICMFTITFKWSYELDGAYRYSLIVGLYFMACVAVERYLLVSHPIWYESHLSLKVCCVISVIIWFVPLIFADVDSRLLFKPLPRSIASFIPYPIVILCFVGTWRGLSRSTSLTPLNRKLILGSLFLVLVTYTCLVLPYAILSFIREMFSINYSLKKFKVFYLFKFIRYLNPLADCILYLLMRPDVGGLMESVHCCCRTDTHQRSTHSRDEHTRDSNGSSTCCVSVQKPVSHSGIACSSV